MGAMASKKAREFAGQRGDAGRQRRRGEGASGDDGRPQRPVQTTDLGPFDGDRRMRGEARLDRFGKTHPVDRQGQAARPVRMAAAMINEPARRNSR